LACLVILAAWEIAWAKPTDERTHSSLVERVYAFFSMFERQLKANPSTCEGESQCRQVKDACAKQVSCEDLKLKPGVVLAPAEWCYIDVARQHCNRYAKCVSECLLGGGIKIAEECWHVCQGEAAESVVVDLKKFYCPVELSAEHQKCSDLSSVRPTSQGQ